MALPGLSYHDLCVLVCLPCQQENGWDSRVAMHDHEIPSYDARYDYNLEPSLRKRAKKQNLQLRQHLKMRMQVADTYSLDKDDLAVRSAPQLVRSFSPRLVILGRGVRGSS
jgi:hypothetical protein